MVAIQKHIYRYIVKRKPGMEYYQKYRNYKYLSIQNITSIIKTVQKHFILFFLPQKSFIWFVYLFLSTA